MNRWRKSSEDIKFAVGSWGFRKVIDEDIEVIAWVTKGRTPIHLKFRIRVKDEPAYVIKVDEFF